MGARRAAAFEGLDDDHAAAAAWARMRERPRLIGIGGSRIAGLGLRNWRIEQFSRPRDVLDTLAAGEQAVVADAMEATWQNVDQEAADELVGGERHELLSFATFGAIVLPLEGDAIAVERDQPAVGDGNAVGVARQIGEHGLGPAEWTLAVDDPFRLACRRQIRRERLSGGERSVMAEELQTAGVVSKTSPMWSGRNSSTRRGSRLG